MENMVRAIVILALGGIRVHRYFTPEPSCFGTPLSALARLPGPIRELRSPEDLLPETQRGGHSSREITKLMGWLTTYGVETVVCTPSCPHNMCEADQSPLTVISFQDDLFIAPGDESLAAQMREVS